MVCLLMIEKSMLVRDGRDAGDVPDAKHQGRTKSAHQFLMVSRIPVHQPQTLKMTKCKSPPHLRANHRMLIADPVSIMLRVIRQQSIVIEAIHTIRIFHTHGISGYTMVLIYC